MDISTAPRDRDIGLAVVDAEGLHALVFPCRRIAGGWVKAATGTRLDVRPTHWRDWSAGEQASARDSADKQESSGGSHK